MSYSSTRSYRRNHFTGFLAFFLGCLILFFWHDFLAAQTFARQVNRLVRPYLLSQKSFGYSVGVYMDGKEFVKGFGQLSEENSQAPNGDTLYEIASITKVMTGILLGDAVLKGEVRLDQPAGELLPEGVEMPKYGEQQILLRDLSTHSSGLPRLPSNMVTKNRPDPYKDYSQEKLFEFLNSHELRYAPRTKYEYSNLGVGLLGDLLASKAESDFPTLLQERVTAPLGLHDTRVILDEEQASRMAPPHRADLEPSVRRQFPVLTGCGSVVSSVNDLLEFGKAILDPPSNSLGQAIDLGFKIHQQPLEGTDLAMCLGWRLSSDLTTRMHSGMNAGYRSTLYVNRKHNLVVVVLANAKEADTPKLATSIYRTAIGRSVKPDDFARPITVSTDLMDRYVGRYQTPGGGVYTVERKGNKLMVQYNWETSYRVFPMTKTAWQYRNYSTLLVFSSDDNEQCMSLEIDKGDRQIIAERVD